MKILKFIFLLSYTISLTAQQQNNVWYFGQNAGIDFSSGEAVALTDGAMISNEGCATVCDSLGNLLFYTNGETIRNKNHGIMLLGGAIHGNSSSTQSSLILPKPSTSGHFYLFTTDVVSGNKGLRWSEIDMSLDNGLGGVLNKNIPLYPSVCEKITTVKHENGIDSWVISHEWQGDAFLAWLVTEQGISTNPIVSNIGSEITESPLDAGGYLKASKDGSRIAAAHWNNVNTVEIFQFNNATGQLSNLILIDNFDPISNGVYGIEFSPSGEFLYVSERATNGGLFQYNLSFWNPTVIENSKFELAIFPNKFGALQLGPDEKIYVALQGYTHLGIIYHPDSEGFSCLYEQDGVYLSGNTSKLGLPNIPHHFFNQSKIESEDYCYGDFTSFSVAGIQTYDSIHWDFGDLNSGINNFSTDESPKHIYTAPGPYTVLMTVYLDGVSTLFKSFIYINDLEEDILIDREGCEGMPEVFSVYVPNAIDYYWSDGTEGPIIFIEESGTYTLEVLLGDCGVLIDSVLVNINPIPFIYLPEVTGFCDTTSAILTPQTDNNNLQYLWHTGFTGSSIPINDNNFLGEYSVTVTAPNGCTNSDATNVGFSSVELESNFSNLKCYGDSSGIAVIFPQNQFNSYSFLWSTGDTTYTVNGLAAGDYTVTVSDFFGCTAMEELTLTQPVSILLDVVVNDDNIATPNPDGAVFITPSQGTPPYKYTWEDFGEIPNPAFDLPGGIYVVTVTDAEGCEVVAEVTVGGTVGIEEVVFLQAIELFPNPTSDFLFIKMPNSVGEDVQFSIFNTLGQTGFNFFIEKNNDGFQIDMIDFETGIYFLKIKKEEEERICKVNVIK